MELSDFTRTGAPIAELNQGVYLIQVVTQTTSKTLKMVKQ
ncbi:MAG: T9SS type A sorting domain-containing protein [Bacteroidetes bacterium]|nr:T9SS type A sorting domain-containing protein [Bacteroidota bacterium]